MHKSELGESHGQWRAFQEEVLKREITLSNLPIE